MKKEIKHLVFTLAIFAGFGLWAHLAHAVNEPGVPDGSFGLSEIAVVKLGTNSTTNVNTETRRIAIADDGRQLVLAAVERSSMVMVNYTTNTNTINGIPNSTATLFMSSVGVTFANPGVPNVTTATFVDNQHVFAIASGSQPVLFQGFVQQSTGSIAQRIRIWDSRGSTDSASFQNLLKFDMSFPSSTIQGFSIPTSVDFNVWFTSGLTVMQQGGNCLLKWALPYQGAKDGMTR